MEDCAVSVEETHNMSSPEDINKALLAFNNGDGLKKFSKKAKSAAISKKKGGMKLDACKQCGSRMVHTHE